MSHTHVAGFYASEAEFRALVTPFVKEGGAVVVMHDVEKIRLLKSWLPGSESITFLPATGMYTTPARTIAACRRLFDQLLANGAKEIRITGAVPHPGTGHRFDGWDRYESAANTIWSSYPLHSLCLYDATTTPPPVRDVVERTHPTLVTGTGPAANPRFDPAFTSLPATPDPLEDDPPATTLVNPSPVDARRAVEDAARARVLDIVTADLVFGVSEATTNAILHGTPPVTLRLWTTPTRVVVHVTDSGPGPRDPHAGLIPAARVQGGLGLWLTHQLDIEVGLITTPDGFTIRLRGGELP
ncbi:anti-sigma factor RsbA family regulatory protein [Actinokineospora soli]